LLTGPRYHRLFLGRWVQAEGVVYEEWDTNIHLIDRFDIPADWRRFRVVDFGYTNPFVCQWWAIDNDDCLYRYREIYMTRRTVKTHAEQINRLSLGESFEATVCDHDAEDRATLEENGITTIPAVKSVSVGIQKLQERLKIGANGKARVYFLRDSLVEVDQMLVEGAKPRNTEQEFDGYIWSNKQTREEPVKNDDHGMDAARYAVMYLDSGLGVGIY
jgi:phage terminase large subunit